LEKLEAAVFERESEGSQQRTTLNFNLKSKKKYLERIEKMCFNVSRGHPMQGFGFYIKVFSKDFQHFFLINILQP
jgi:hypothetical protein